MLPRELDRRKRKRRSDASLAESGPRYEAGHGPNTRVSLVFVSTLPGDAVVTEQSCVRSALFDGAPARWRGAEVRDQAARRASLGVAAVGLLSESERQLIW